MKEGVKSALRAGLHAMAHHQCDVALLAGVSTGLYAGPFHQQLQTDFPALADEVLKEPLQHTLDGPRLLGECFQRVIWTKLS